MAKKRERLEVVYDILNSVREHHNSIMPTRLQQKSNLSPQMFKEYTEELLEKKFLISEEKEGHKQYILTDKGYEFLSKYKQAMELIENFGL
jgi:predicted transcriptional regulator